MGRLGLGWKTCVQGSRFKEAGPCLSLSQNTGLWGCLGPAPSSGWWWHFNKLVRGMWCTASTAGGQGEGGTSSPSSPSCGLCLLPGRSGLAFDSQQTGKEARLISASEATTKMSRGKRDPSPGWGGSDEGPSGPCSPSVVSSGSKEARSALESRRVSLGAHWVDSRESSLLRRLERGREIGR